MLHYCIIYVKQVYCLTVRSKLNKYTLYASQIILIALGS